MPRDDAPRPSGELRFFPLPALVALVLLVAFGLGYAALFTVSRYPFEYLEGVLLDAGRRILDGSPLYCDLRQVPCVLLPHPPVYIGFVAGLAKVFGLSVGLGRGVSFAALCGTLALLRSIAVRLGAGPRAALLAPALYLVFVEVAYFSALLRPESLALMIELAAIRLLLEEPRWARSMGGAALLVVALFAKPNLLAGPAAITLVLAARDRRQLAPFALTGALCVGLVLFVGDRLTGGVFTQNHVLSHAGRIHAWDQFTRILWYGALPWLPLLLAATALAVREALRRRIDFAVLFFFAALVWCLYSASLQGAAAYYYLELYAATGLVFATRIEALSAPAPVDARVESRFSFRRVLRVALWAQLALALVVNPAIAAERYQSYLRVWNRGPELVAELAAAPGMILVEDPSAAAAANRTLLAEVFMNNQAAQKGTWDEGPMVALLTNGGISRVVLRETSIENVTWLQRERFTPRMLDAIRKNYALAWSDGSWFVYAFRTPTPS
jgi:hypothetical protein